MLLRCSRTLRVVIPVALVICLWAAPFARAEQSLDRTGRLWSPYLEWNLLYEGYSGNPFDVLATVTFRHQPSGEQRTTEMFYDGEDTWRFRFTGTRTGTWTFVTASEHEALDDHRGRVIVKPNPDPEARGFIVAHGNKYAWQVGENGQVQPFPPNIYMNLVKWGVPERCGWTAVSPTFSDPEVFAAYLDEAAAHGCNGVFARMGNQWFKAQAVSYRDHDSENPDPVTFRAMEQAISQAHDRGMFLHMWVWGDEQRRWTPVGVADGINGEADRRLQRYMAARLGPVPGWTMSYGSDLNEWVQTEQVASWGAYMQERSGWDLMLSAREAQRFRSPETLPIASNDERPRGGFYELARQRLTQAPVRPVLFERRFSHMRDDVWDMKTTRRAFWQFAMAGGAASIWGHYPAEGACSARFRGDYPDPEQLRTHRRFWQERFPADMEPANELNLDEGAMVLRSERDELVVVYREAARRIQVDLSGMARAQRVVAVDATADYAEIDLGVHEPGRHVIELPHRSDWAVAITAER